MRAQEIRRHVLIFLRQDRTRRVDERSAGPHIARGIFEDAALQRGQLRQLPGIFIADIRLLADDPQSRARNVRHDEIGLPVPRCVVLTRVGEQRAHAPDAEPLRPALDEPELMRIDVAREDLAAVLHVDREGEGLAARGGAHVEHAAAHPRRGDKRDKPRRRVLHHEASLAEGGELFEIARPRHEEAPGKPRVRLHVQPRTPQLTLKMRSVRFQKIRLDARRHRLVVKAQVLLRLLRPQQLQKPPHEPARVAVAHGEVFLRRLMRQLRHVFAVCADAAQDGVHHARGLRPPVLPGHLDGLADRRVLRHLIQKQDLVRAHAQDIADDRLEPRHLLAAPAADIEIEQHAVLHHAIGDARRERRVPAVEPTARNAAAQPLVRPRVRALDLHQRVERDVPRALHSFLLAHRQTGIS